MRSRRWSQDGAGPRSPTKVEVDFSSCPLGVPAAAAEALDALYSSLSSKSQLLAAFRTVDSATGTWRSGRKGALGCKELRKTLALLHVPLNDHQVRHVIAAIDADGDGEVDVHEFVDFVWKGRMDRLRRKLDSAAYVFGGRDYVRLFQQYDRDNSGSLDFDEFRRAVRKDCKVKTSEVPDSELKELFDHVDDDGSGEIDVEEFVELLQPVSMSVHMQSLQSGDGGSLGTPGASLSMSVAGAAKARRAADAAEAAARGATVCGRVLGMILDHAAARRTNVLRTFQRFDADGSGELDADELKAALREIGLVVGPDDLRSLLASMDTDGDGTISLSEFAGKLRQTKRDRYTVAAFEGEPARRSRASSPTTSVDRTESEAPSRDDASEGGGQAQGEVWIVSCERAAEQRAWLSAMGEATGEGASSALQAGVEEAAAKSLQAASRGMLVRHTPDIRLRQALRRAALRDHELLKLHELQSETLQSESSEDSPSEDFVADYEGPENVEIERLRQNLKAASYGKGGEHLHDQDPRTLFQTFDRSNTGVLSRADFAALVRKAGKANAAMLGAAEMRQLFDAINTSGTGAMSVEELCVFVWGAHGAAERWATVLAAERKASGLGALDVVDEEELLRAARAWTLAGDGGPVEAWQ